MAGFLPAPFAGLTAVEKDASADLALAIAAADVSGMTYTTPAGTAKDVLVSVSLLLENASGFGASDVTATLLVGGVAQTQLIRWKHPDPASTMWVPLAASWMLTNVSGGTVIKVQASEAGAHHTVKATHSRMVVTLLS